MKTTHTKFSNERGQATRHILKLCLLPVFMLMVWVGCKEQPKAAADANPAGTYALISVDTNKVPCTVEHEGHKLTVKSGTFVINADGTCSSKVVFSPPSGEDATREVKATYTREGQKLTMKWEGAGMTIGTVEGDNFTMNNEGMIFAYRK